MNADTMIGAEIRAARCGVTQDALAERMRGYGFGWHQQTVLKVESGKRPLKLAEAQVVAIILGTTVERLLPPAPTPPRPDEPQGLGAVVEDANGDLFVRWSTRHREDRNWKHNDNQGGDYRSWDNVNVVRVLSEGVTP